MKKLLNIFLALNLLVLDISFGFLFYTLFIKTRVGIGSEISPKENPIFEASSESTCGEDCKTYIDERIAQGLQAAPIPTPTAGTIAQTQSPKKIRKVNYVPIPGSGSTKETVWTSIPSTDFYMTKGDYQGLVGVYFEGNIKLVNGNGVAYVRLYDATHSVAVPGSELSTSSQQSSFVTTGPVTLWEGYNNYKIQARSLTADTTVFESGRLKIITEE
ncbi:hypothetical protein A2714_01725 [Candidatus Woesebacteria bacterium RIFCSPHIGHO2_01_FULL_38_9]|uniref:Uncharacterized protein n=2 Tax=Candidatus Woeseibacteriota TaxID=1752722 RepID=A0A1F7XZI5_9BACT|nr:MAG: hypothetical protein A2714_01725 [Candidatus Woesebacteria bacterium RIFCSPHIGHO2_01_FULL_38_9]OGM59365.1 MAG: hypothetical protein A3A75_03370 [Candidatus Woesebacteria bacterium RIFCSPLOWO2_01_FULL_39_10]